MALINCKECGNEMSDTAASCPKCGATKCGATISDKEQCPHCMSMIRNGAWVCSGCGAKKGYSHKHGNVYGKTSTIIRGVFAPMIIVVMTTAIAIAMSSSIWVVSILFALITLLFLSIALFFAHRVVRGPVWYR
jgi:hypothetical protein